MSRYPVLFEFANHIAQIVDGTLRHKLAGKLKSEVSSSLAQKSPWIIMPFRQNELIDEIMKALEELCGTFAAEYAAQGISLTDVAVIDAAQSLTATAAKHTPRATVHIWTRDNALKAREPDPEVDPFV